MSAFTKDIVIHWADQTSRVTREQLAQDVGVDVSDVDHAIAGLVSRRLLVLRPDGDYDASVPDEVSG